MKETITSREELLWAKLAGKDVDISTMTPPVYTNLVEEFMAETAERIDNAGSGGSGGYTYETVFTTTIPQMDYDDGWYAVNGTSYEGIDINPGDDLAFLSSECPLTFLESGEDASLWGLNITADFQKTGEPAYGFLVGIDKTSFYFYSSVDLSNTTLQILKKVSSGGAGLPAVTSADNGKVLKVVNGAWDKTEDSGGNVDDKIQADSTNPVENGAIYDEFEDVYARINNAKPLVVKGALGTDEGVIYVTITTPLEDIYRAADNGRAVFLEWTDTEDGSTTRLGLVLRTVTEGAYTLGFSACTVSGGAGMVVVCGFDNSLVGELKIASAS